MKQSISAFIQTQRQKQLFKVEALIVYLNQSIERLWQKYKEIRQKAEVGLCNGTKHQHFKMQTSNGSSYNTLQKELNHLRKTLINIPNGDNNKCLKWCLVGYLNSSDYHPALIRKIDKIFRRKLDFKDTKFPVMIRNNHQIERKKYYLH